MSGSNFHLNTKYLPINDYSSLIYSVLSLQWDEVGLSLIRKQALAISPTVSTALGPSVARP